jgi:zinc transporter ZupT
LELAPLLIETFIAAAVTDLATGLGAVPFLVLRHLPATVEAWLTAVAAGMMTTASVLQLVGQGADLAPGAGIWEVGLGLLLGAAFFALVSDKIRASEDFDLLGIRKAGGAGALLVVAALTIHSLPEGIAIGVAYGSAAETGTTAFGLSVATALAFHNIPEGMAIAVALRGRGVSPWVAIGWAVISSLPQPIAAPPAAAAVWLFEPLLPAGLGFAAGAMVYLVMEELLPDAYERAGRKNAAIGFMFGLVAMLLIGRMVGVN